MQTAGMLRGTRAIYFLVLLAPLVIDHAHSYPYQLLPSIPGYIPVYIRNGDQPLEEINPALAEAFHEHSSLSKSIRLDRNLGHLELTENSRTNSVIDGSTKQYYPAHAREAGNAIVSNERDEDETHVEKSSEHQVPKLVSLYELHEKLKKKTQQEEQLRTSSKEESTKANPVSLLEKENFDKDETKPNDLYDPNPNYPELPSDIGHNRDTSQDFVSVIGLDALTEQPNVRQYKDLSHLTDERNAVDDKNEKEEEPVKVQRPSDILSNVQKLSPIAPPEAYTTEKSKESSEIKTGSKIENRGTDEPPTIYYKDLSNLSGDQKVVESSEKKEKESEKKEENSMNVAKDSVLKETGNEELLPNVFKLLPIAPPESYTTEKSQDNSEIKTEIKIDNEETNEPPTVYYKDLSNLSGDQKVVESSEKKEKESEKKEENPMNVAKDPETVPKEMGNEEQPSNVLKLLPISSPEAYESEEKSTQDKVKEVKSIDTSVIRESIDQPTVHLYKDLSHPSSDQRDAKTSSSDTKEENQEPVKQESPLEVPANVVKFSPIAPPEVYMKENKDATSNAALVQEIVQDDEKKDFTNRNDDVST